MCCENNLFPCFHRCPSVSRSEKYGGVLDFFQSKRLCFWLYLVKGWMVLLFAMEVIGHGASRVVSGITSGVNGASCAEGVSSWRVFPTACPLAHV